MPSKRYRLYIDESGDHTYTDRYLGITGVMFELGNYANEFYPDLEALKHKHFPRNPDEGPVVLHRKELINKQGPFWRLKDPEKEKDFNTDFLDLLRQSKYKVFTIVIDKKSHYDRYEKAAMHPYHYCLTAILERYCGFLKFYNVVGDVMAESRGGKEDMQLKEAYKNVYESGTFYHKPDFFQKSLTSKEIKIKRKQDNISGLQIADLLAHPCKNEVLLERGKISEVRDGFGKEICLCITKKYNRHIFKGHTDGYGKVFLG